MPFVIKFVLDFAGVETTVVVCSVVIAPVELVKPVGNLHPSLFDDFQQAFDYAADFLPRVGWPVKGMSIEPAPADLIVDVEADGTPVVKEAGESHSYADQVR